MQAAPREGAGLSRAARAVVTAAGVYTVLLAVLLRAHFVDDAWIGLRCVENLLAGRGFVFNPGEAVEAVTNAGWLLLLTPLALVMPLTLAAKLCGTAFVLITVWLVSRVARQLARAPGDYAFTLPLVLLIVAQADFMLFSLTGMETALLAAGLSWMVYSATAPCAPPRRTRVEVTRATVGALLYLVHPEAVLVWPLAELLRRGVRRTAWLRQRPAIMAFIGVLLAITAIRSLCFGDPLPNTFYAKAVQAGDVANRLLSLLSGTNSNVSYPLAGLAPLLFVAAGLLAVWRRFASRSAHNRAGRAGAAYLTAAVTVGLAFACYSSLDWTGMGRYFAPYAPLALLALWRGMVALSRSTLRRFCSATAINLALVGLACVVGFIGVLRTFDAVSPQRAGAYPGYVIAGESLVAPARWLGEHLPPDAIIATRRIGAVGYYSGHRVLDYKFGLPHRNVARLIRGCGHQFDTPLDSALAEAWQEVRPDYLLEDRPVIDAIIGAVHGSDARFEIHGIPYRVIRTFPIGAADQWVLCEQIADSLN